MKERGIKKERKTRDRKKADNGEIVWGIIDRTMGINPFRKGGEYWP
jgi:hypothetical protein